MSKYGTHAAVTLTVERNETNALSSKKYEADTTAKLLRLVGWRLTVPYIVNITI